MKRNVVVLTLIILVIAALLWAGIENGRMHKLEQELRATRAMSMPGMGNTAAPTADEQDAEGILKDLRGKPAPAFTLTTLDGKQVSLADYKGKAVLVNFWATWCAPCKLEMPWFIDFEKEYGPQGLVVLGVTQDDAPKDEIQKFVQKIGLNYPVLIGGDKISTAYGGIEYLPSTFYIGRDGKVVAQAAGLISRDEVEANIKKALAEGASTSAGGQVSAGGHAGGV